MPNTGDKLSYDVVGSGLPDHRKWRNITQKYFLCSIKVLMICMESTVHSPKKTISNSTSSFLIHCTRDVCKFTIWLDVQKLCFVYPLPLKRGREQNMSLLIQPIMQLHFSVTLLLDSNLPLFCLFSSTVATSKEEECNVRVQHWELCDYMIAVSVWKKVQRHVCFTMYQESHPEFCWGTS
jgi:hypothetical protein